MLLRNRTFLPFLNQNTANLWPNRPYKVRGGDLLGPGDILGPVFTT